MHAQPDSWKHEAFGKVEPIPYVSSFSDAEFRRIQLSLVPEQMEDKWFIYYVEPSLFLHRSWTGKAVYRVDFEADASGAKIKQAVCDVDALATCNVEYEAKLLSFLIGNLLLGRNEPFPRPEGLKEPAPGAFQHVVSGTGYREVSAEEAQPTPER